MEPIGQILKQARERKGITQQQAKEALRFHGPFVEALEAEEFDKLPAPTYARAFLREYARYLGLDPEPLVQEYKARNADKEPGDLKFGWTSAPQAQPHWGGLIAPALVACALGVILLGSWYVFQFQTGKAESERMSAAAGKPVAKAVSSPLPGVKKPPLAAPKSVVPVIAVPAGKPAAPASIPTAGANVPAVVGETIGAANSAGPNPAANLPATPAGAVPTSGIPSPSVQALPAGKGVATVVTAAQTCWLRIKVDGKLQYEGVLRPGETRSWQATETLDVVAGNAGGIRLTVNGKELGSLGKPGQVLHRQFKAGPDAQVAQQPDTL